MNPEHAPLQWDGTKNYVSVYSVAQGARVVIIHVNARAIHADGSETEVPDSVLIHGFGPVANFVPDASKLTLGAQIVVEDSSGSNKVIVNGAKVSWTTPQGSGETNVAPISIHSGGPVKSPQPDK